MNILQRSMASQGILNDTQTTLADYLMSIAQISVEDAGAIYIELIRRLNRFTRIE